MTVAVERVSHYRLVERLGKGAMGEVYRALDERLGRQVALKLLPHKHAGHSGWQARLLREAQAASALNHPGLVTVHDVGSWQGRVFLVMELVEGDVLSELAARGLALDEALRIVEEAASALGAAHDRGILHRDIKCANLMVTTEGRVKVLDFGLAKLHEPGERTPVPTRRSTPVPIVRGDDAVAATLLPDAELGTTQPSITPTPSDLTAVGDLVGTPAYMAPEVAAGADPDHVSEVWSLGVVLYELVAGMRPFDRGDIGATLDAVREAKPRPPSEAAPDRKIPAAIDAIVARALQRDPAARLPSMNAFAAALRAARRVPEAVPSAPPPPPPRRPVALIAGGVAVVALGGVFAVRALGDDADRAVVHDAAVRVAEVKVTSTRRLTFDRGCEEFPSFLPDGRRLVFDLDGTGNNDLYLLDVDTGERTRLTENPGWDYGAAVSPDGKYVAYTHHTNVAGLLHVLSIGAAEDRAVSLGPVVGMPVWSAANTLLAGVPARDVVRWTIAADGSAGPPERIATAPPTYLPYILAPLDETRLWVLLRTNSETGRVALGEISGGAIRVLESDLFEDEGGLIAQGESVYVTRSAKADSNELTRTSRAHPGELVTVPGGLSPRSGLTISADGRRLVWSTCRAVTHLVALVPGQPPRELEPRGAWNDSYPVVVDEQRLLFSSTRAGSSQVWLLDRSTGATRALTRDRTSQPAISPDRTLLAYADEDSGAIFVMPLDGGAPRQVTDGPDDSSPAFTRDGKQLVFQRAVEVEGPRVFVAPLDGGEPRALTPPGAQDPSTSRADDLVVYLFRTTEGTVPMVTDLTGRTPTPLAPELPPGEIWEPERTADGKRVLLLGGSDILEVPIDGSTPPVLRWQDPTIGVEAAVPEGDGMIASLVYWEGDLWIAEGEFPVIRAWIAVLALAACSRPAAPDARVDLDAAPVVAAFVPEPDAMPPPPPPPPPPPKPRRWIAGDPHMHVAPPGATRDVTMSIPQIAREAKRQKLEFVIVVPHLWTRGWVSLKQRAKWQGLWHTMAALARAQRSVTVIPGVEYGESGIGHFGISGVEVDQLEGPSLLDAAHAAGAFIVINHPFAVPTNVPGVRISNADLSYKPWTSRKPIERRDPIDGVEVWNHMLRYAHLVSPKNEARGFAAAERLVREERRPIALVGGSDNHRDWIKPTTWVLATDASEAAILDGLRAGATCVGGPEAALEAHGDADPPDRWAAIGETVRGERVELRWKGKGKLFIDGVDRGKHDGHFVDEGAAGLHTYRLEIGKSRCGFVYANLDG